MIDRVSNTSKMNLVSSDEAFRRTSHTAKTMSSFEIELAKTAKAARARGDSIDKIAHALKLSSSSVKSLIDLQINIPMTRQEREEEIEQFASQEEEESDVDAVAKKEHLASAEEAYAEMYGKSFAKKKIDIMASGKSIPKSRKGDWSEMGGPKRQLRYNNSIWDADILAKTAKQQDNGERIREENARIKAERQQARHAQTHVTTDDMYQQLRESVELRKTASVQQTGGNSQESYDYNNRVQRNGMSIFDDYKNTPFDRIAEKTEGERERDISRTAKKKDRSWVKTASTNSMQGKFKNMLDSLIDD
jgi:hypothetical protein